MFGVWLIFQLSQTSLEKSLKTVIYQYWQGFFFTHVCTTFISLYFPWSSGISLLFLCCFFFLCLYNDYVIIHHSINLSWIFHIVSNLYRKWNKAPFHCYFFFLLHFDRIKSRSNSQKTSKATAAAHGSPPREEDCLCFTIIFKFYVSLLSILTDRKWTSDSHTWILFYENKGQ